jgi:hypothetical protein
MRSAERLAPGAKYCLTGWPAAQRCLIPLDWIKQASFLQQDRGRPASTKCCASPPPESARLFEFVFSVGVLDVRSCTYRLVRFQGSTQSTPDHR